MRCDTCDNPAEATRRWPQGPEYACQACKQGKGWVRLPISGEAPSYGTLPSGLAGNESGGL